MAMGGSAPTHGNGMSTREHWDGCPSVFDLRWKVRVMRCRGDLSEQDGRIVGETVHARGDDGWRWAGPPLRMQGNVNERTLG